MPTEPIDRVVRSHLSFDRLTRQFMRPLEVASSTTMLRILARKVFDMILRAVGDLLFVDANGAMTMQTAYGMAGGAYCL